MADAGLDSGELSDAFGVGKDAPSMLNISDDPTMAGMLIFYLKEGQVPLGKNPGPNAIKINGLGIKDNMGYFTNKGNEELTITP